MKQTVRIIAIPAEGVAEVFFERKSACSGDCGHCGGCGAVREQMLVRAENSIGAAVGDLVVVETATKTVMKAALLVYLLPVVLFFAVYFAAQALGLLPGLFGLLGFVLGLVPALLLNRRMEKGKAQTFRIVAYAQEL